MNVKVYTDGSCKGNPGPGGFGVYLSFSDGEERRLSEGYYKTTNNRMELLGFFTALEYLRVSKFRGEVVIYTDSKYISEAINKGWLTSWAQKGFFKRINADLWTKILDNLKHFGNRVRIEWVKGHSISEGNVIADSLAVAASLQPKYEDSEYIKSIEK